MDDGSLTWAAHDWMKARGIESVDCHGRFVYAEDDPYADSLCYYCGESTTDDPEGEYGNVGVNGIAHRECLDIRS